MISWLIFSTTIIIIGLLIYKLYKIAIKLYNAILYIQKCLKDHGPVLIDIIRDYNRNIGKLDNLTTNIGKYVDRIQSSLGNAEVKIIELTRKIDSVNDAKH